MVDDLSECIKRLWELYDEILMLFATDLGLDINELSRPIIAADGGRTFLLNDLRAQASPITNPRVLELLKEYDALEDQLGANEMIL